MAKKKPPAGESRTVGFHMPTKHFDIVQRVATARGTDLSAVFNQIIAEALPELRRWLKAYEQTTGTESP